MMFIKRTAAVFAAILLIFALSSCKNESTYISISSLPQTESAGEIHIESSSESASQNADSSHQNNSSDKAHGDSTSSNESQIANNSQQTDSNNQSYSSAVSSDDEQDKQQENNSSASVTCEHSGGDPYQNVSKTEFYADYKTACCNLDATYRSAHGLLSGSLEIPGQYAEESKSRPMSDKKYIRNTTTMYLDNGNTYVVLDANGREAMRIHKAGGYITLEEVAAYMYAFGGNGTIPANYISKKKGNPNSSIWGEYLRVNHSYFIGDTERYPYEPELPDISGCGGRLRYYEMDIGTTGTVTPGYPAKPYIQGSKINRGAARIVYARQDLNGNGIFENNEIYVFYTHNHYNDFREYLNYYGGWGEMFGNITGGGVYSSETNANPTPYVTTAYKAF